MLYLSSAALLGFAPIVNGVTSGFVASSPQLSFRTFSRPSTATLQTRNDPRASSPSDLPGRRLGAQNVTITTGPVTYPQYPGPSDHWCLVGDPTCTRTKTWDGPSLSLNAQCVLWDSSCTGDVDAAARNFFDNVEMMNEKPCWKQGNNASYSCSLYEPLETLSAMSSIKEWMRGTQCLQLRRSLELITTTMINAGTTLVTTTAERTHVGETCCGDAIIKAQNVDIYYWPVPDADTSCLSVVGNSVNALYYGATTDAGPAYWGCTAISPETSTTTSPIIGPSGDVIASSTITVVQSIITTARITEINSLKFRIPIIDPRSPPACIGITSAHASSSAHAADNVQQKWIGARGHSLAIPASMTQDDGLPVSTVVSGAFTFTSPSIYANFHSILAADWCGQVGSEATITQTMLTFTPGELSTIAGPLYNPVGALYQNYSTKVFDFADLPCPPQSVMEENWYIPAPGEPYRPLVALPKKVMDMDPGYASVTNAFFTAYDPPMTLVAAAAMVPEMTTINAVAPSLAPIPGPSMNAGVPKTTDLLHKPISASTRGQEIPLSGEKPKDPVSEQYLPSQKPGIGSKLQESGLRISNGPTKQTGTAQNPRLASRPSTLDEAKPTDQQMSDLDSEYVSPDQTLRIESTRALRPHSQLTIDLDGPSKNFQTGVSTDSQKSPGGTWTVGTDAAHSGNLAQGFAPANASNLPELYVSGSANAMDIDAAGIRAETDIWATASDGIPSGQSIVVENEDPIVRSSGSEGMVASLRGGHADDAVSIGFLLPGNSIISSAAAIRTSNSVPLVNSAHAIPLGDAHYRIFASSPVSITALASGADIVPFKDALPTDGTALRVGASATYASKTPVSFSVPSILIIAGEHGDRSREFIASDPSRSDNDLPDAKKQEATALASNIVEVNPLSRGPSAVPTSGVAVMGSQTMAVGSSSVGLGGYILGGLHTDGVPNNSASTSRSTSGADNHLSEEHTHTSRAGTTKSSLSGKLCFNSIVLMTVWLHA